MSKRARKHIELIELIVLCTFFGRTGFSFQPVPISSQHRFFLSAGANFIPFHGEQKAAYCHSGTQNLNVSGVPDASFELYKDRALRVTHSDPEAGSLK